VQCPRCLAVTDDSAAYCSQCGFSLTGGGPRGDAAGPHAEASYAQGQPEFNDHLLGSILVTIFCCLPLGIPAIVFAADARTKFADGNYSLARRSANTANTFITIAFWLGFVNGIIYFFIYLFVIGALIALD
jgi:hypothetical protein